MGPAVEIPSANRAGAAESLRRGLIVSGERGAYRVEERVGRGGMGAVYRARRTSDARAVALKVVHDTSPELHARLEREARIIGSLDHPNLVRVHEVLRLEDGSPVVVMDLLHGETLGARLRREPVLPVAEAARIGLGIAAALQAAHDVDVVHRDLKPENVFLTSVDGLPFVKVLDFGIAKATRGAALLEGLPSLETRTGHILGTPQYMAPEQIFGEKDVDARADVWALGVLLYEALAGLRPFDGENVGQVFKAIALEPPRPLGERRSDLPRSLVALVTRMLAHARDERLPRIADVRVVLEPLAAGRADAAVLDLATAATVDLETPHVGESLRPRAPSRRTLVLVAMFGAVAAAAGARHLVARGGQAEAPVAGPPLATASAAPIVATVNPPSPVPSVVTSTPAPSAPAPVRLGPRVASSHAVSAAPSTPDVPPSPTAAHGARSGALHRDEF
ncbi:MAG: Serine/threonine-protein kinase pkn3 [Labilithrix sp.]|nr:Serine/threonine-protein kinase pkn3 [Labilithrix sp.]